LLAPPGGTGSAILGVEEGSQPVPRRLRLLEEVSVMRVRISPEMDFYIDMELQGVTERTRDLDIQQYEKVVYDEFISRIRKAFPEGDFRVVTFDFNLARESSHRAA
jgi:hypothetical protein